MKDKSNEEVKQNIVISEPESSNLALMKQLANNDLSIPVEMNAEQLLDRTKLFLIARARNSLNRIIKLTAFMEKLEDKFMNTMDNYIDDDNCDLDVLTLAMETVSKCISDANDCVMQVMKDDKLQQIVINTTNIITPDGNSATIIDGDSRDEVRNLAASLLAQLSNYADSDIVEVDSNDIDDADS